MLTFHVHDFGNEFEVMLLADVNIAEFIEYFRGGLKSEFSDNIIEFDKVSCRYFFDVGMLADFIKPLRRNKRATKNCGDGNS